MPFAAYVDFDSITCGNPSEYGEPLFELGHRSAASLEKKFLRSGYDTVVICPGCGLQEHVDRFLSLVPVRRAVFWFFIHATKEGRKRGKSQRARECADNEEHFDYIDAKNEPFKGLVSGPGIKAFEVVSDGKTAEKIALELSSIILQNLGE